MHRRVLLLVITSFFLATTSVSAQVQRTLTWDPPPMRLEDVLEFHVFRDFLYVGATSAPGLTFPFTILPGELVTFHVASFGWVRDESGNRTGETGVGAWSMPADYTEPEGSTPPPPLTATWPSSVSVTVTSVPTIVTFPDPIPAGGTPPYTTRCTPESGSAFYAGDTFVACRADDAAGLIVSGGFGVHVDVVSPAPQGCRLNGGLLNGQPYPIGYRIQVSMAQKQIDAFVTARRAEGWFEWRTRSKVKNQTTLYLECRGL